MEKVKSAVPRGAIRINVTVQVLAAFVLLLAANYWSFNHYWRADYSRSQKFVLSDQTRHVLRDLSKPVKIIVFFSPTSVSPETQLYGDVTNLLKELSFSGKPKVQVEYVDPNRNLPRARELQTQYKFRADENVLILDYDGRTKFVPVADMGDFDMSAIAEGEPPRLQAFKGEQVMVNALIALMNPEKPKVYVLQGHGEPSLDPGSALTLFKDYVERQNVKMDRLSLNSTDSVPADSACVVILAAQFDLEEREALILSKYWRSKGRLLILLDPKAKTPRLDALVQGAGITPMDDRVLRTIRLPFATGILREVTAEFMDNNAVTRRMAGMNILFPGATQSLSFDVKKSQTAGVQIWPLIRAGEEFWGETDYIPNEKKGVHYDEGIDHGYPVYVAAAAARGGVNDDRVEVENSKMIAVGTCEFALDAGSNPQGLDFLLSSMNWLVDRQQLTGVAPKTISHFTLNLPDAQLSRFTLWVMIIIPAVAACLGLLVWWRRRS
ncbi:Gldg family protein [soil metagenome]